MKLSDVRGERVFDVIADIIGPVAAIAADEEAMRLFNASGKPEGMTAWQYFVKRASESVPAIMRNHREELCEILAAVNGVGKDAYVNGEENPDFDESRADEDGYDVPRYVTQPISVPKLFSDVLDLVNDSEFISFFS